MGAERLFIPIFPNINTGGVEYLNLTNDGLMSFKKVEDLNSMHRRAIKTILKKLKIVGIILSDEVIIEVVEEEGFADDILQVLEDLQRKRSAFIDVTVEVHSQAIYDEILEAAISTNLVGSCGMESEAMANSKYKTAAKKVKPMATQLPPDTNDHVQQARKESRMKETRTIGHKFIEETMAKLKIGADKFLNEQEKKMF
jgi:hypothetical protein